MDLGLFGQVASSVGRSAFSRAGEAAENLVGKKTTDDEHG